MTIDLDELDKLGDAMFAELKQQEWSLMSVELTATPVEMMSILGLLQIVLSYPAFNEHTPDGLRALSALACKIAQRLSEFGPATKELCELNHEAGLLILKDAQ